VAYLKISKQQQTRCCFFHCKNIFGWSTFGQTRTDRGHRPWIYECSNSKGIFNVVNWRRCSAYDFTWGAELNKGSLQQLQFIYMIIMA